MTSVWSGAGVVRGLIAALMPRGGGGRRTCFCIECRGRLTHGVRTVAFHQTTNGLWEKEAREGAKPSSGEGEARGGLLSTRSTVNRLGARS